MIDAHGRPQSVLVLGGGSEIGLAALRVFGPTTLRRIVLAGRPGASLDSAVQSLTSQGFSGVVAADLDVADVPTHEAFVDAAFDAGDIDVVLLVAGVLGDQAEFEADPDAAVAAAQVNYVGSMSLALHVARRLTQQAHGVIVVVSSVAGERARRSNFVYGSTKAAIDSVGLGLVEVLRGTGARALVVRPGFVRTRMTSHLPEAPLAVDPDEVGRAIVDGIAGGKELVYAPPLMRPVMSVLRHLPRPVFRRLGI
ncbi:MAG: decaprenylphospho-beta-D-erythro-pentofuranosid-2-ulose 2-reductase [Actinobacteria bacterium]|nr:decaprenylphospho-beta-D-erythro-pentofuranosid-2-ulose 2-reductase [Actinomycetota bacterium]